MTKVLLSPEIIAVEAAVEYAGTKYNPRPSDIPSIKAFISHGINTVADLDECIRTGEIKCFKMEDKSIDVLTARIGYITSNIMPNCDKPQEVNVYSPKQYRNPSLIHQDSLCKAEVLPLKNPLYNNPYMKRKLSKYYIAKFKRDATLCDILGRKHLNGILLLEGINRLSNHMGEKPTKPISIVPNIVLGLDAYTDIIETLFCEHEGELDVKRKIFNFKEAERMKLVKKSRKDILDYLLHGETEFIWSPDDMMTEQKNEKYENSFQQSYHSYEYEWTFAHYASLLELQRQDYRGLARRLKKPLNNDLKHR